MTVIELPDEQAAALKAKASAAGLTLEAWLQKLAAEQERPPSQPPRHIADVICENMQDVPPEIMAPMPTDGASQHDHLHLRLAQERGMSALFADTFYWIALTDFSDSAHQRALTLTSELAASRIVTTDEVLTEYLTFFSTAPEPLRREVAESVEGILSSSVIRVIPQSRESFLAGLQPGRLY